MLSTPLISCSIGVATVFDTTSADAPANEAVTSTVGGAISGYSLIGSARNDMAPTSVRMIAMTAANIGRSMKKSESRMVIGPVAAVSRLAKVPVSYGAAALMAPSSAVTF